MKRWMMIGLTAALAAAAGCQSRHQQKPAEPAPPPVQEVRTQWKWMTPGAVVLEVRAVSGGYVALASGREEGLAPDLTMSIYHGNDQLATVRVVDVGREFTVARIVDGSESAIQPGDVGVYVPRT
jgi:hypothetical protein